MRSTCLGAALFAFLGGLGCTAVFGPPHGAGATKEPVRWIVVERCASDLAKEGVLPEGQVEPSASLLVMQPLYGEDLDWVVSVEPHDFFVELLEVSPSGTAAPGEVVSARLRIGKAKADAGYRIIAKPLNSGVTMLSDPEQYVRGSECVLFRFTSIEGGRGGIAVGVERIE